MYKVIETSLESDDDPKFAFSIANENRVFCDISDDESVAKKFADLLNENDVDEIHVADIIEDYFYG